MRANVVERSMTRFLRHPPSVRGAARVIVVATGVVVVAGGAAMRIFDHAEYSNVWVGMWWALQTVTTVGYGDVVPKAGVGRVIGGFEMVLGVSFITFLTAGVTSTILRRAQDTAPSADVQAITSGLAEIHKSMAAVDERLKSIESRLGT